MTFVVDIVTGASQGIGRAIAETIAFHRNLESASSPNYSLVMVGRNVDRGTKAAAAIEKSVSGKFAVLFEPCDLSDHSDVLSLRDRIRQRVTADDARCGGGGGEDDDFKVGILVNDAAECPRRQKFVQRPQLAGDGEKTTVDIDRQFGSNVLGYHFMLRTFRDFFSAEVDLTADREVVRPTHVVNVASNWAGNLDLDDLHFRRRTYDNDLAYRQSKQADRMLNKVWSDELKGVAVVNSCHPGDPCTTLSRALGYNLWSSAPSRGSIESESPIPFLCGFGRKEVEVTGGWFDGPGESPSRCQFSGRTKEAKRLFDICESFATSP